jgi:hypothetical protein
MMSSEGQEREVARRSSAKRELVGMIAGSNDADTEWWNYRAYNELGDLTPTQAWLRGDHEAVKKLIDDWYAATERSAIRFRNDPDFMDSLRRKSAAIAHRSHHSA